MHTSAHIDVDRYTPTLSAFSTLHAYILVHVHTHINVYTNTYTHARTCFVRVYVCTQVLTHTCTYAYIFTYIRTYSVRIASKGKLWHPSTYSAARGAVASFRFLNRPESFTGGSLVTQITTESVTGESVTIGWQIVGGR